MQLGRGSLGHWDLSERICEPFSPDGRTVAVLDTSGRLLALDSVTGRVLKQKKLTRGAYEYVSEYKWLDSRRLSVRLSGRQAVADTWLPIVVR